EDTEVDALRGQPGLASRPGARGIVHEIGALFLQIATHFGRQRLDDAESHQCRRVPLVAGGGALPVSFEEHGVCLRAGAVRATDPVARGAGDGFRTAEDAGVHATERPGWRPSRVASAQPVAEVGRVLEEQLPETRQLPETDLPAGDAFRVERGSHLAEEMARLRSLREAQLVTPRRQALRFPRRVQAEGGRAGEGWA